MLPRVGYRFPFPVARSHFMIQLILGDLVPKLKFEEPLIFNRLLVEMQDLEGGFTAYTPDSVFPSFVDDLLDLHFPDRDKTERLESVTDEDIFHDLLAGEYVTTLDTVTVLEHRPPMQQTPKSEPTSFISIKSAFIGLPDMEDRVMAILSVSEAEDTSS
jgi:hypothetical protein